MDEAFGIMLAAQDADDDDLAAFEPVKALGEMPSVEGRLALLHSVSETLWHRFVHVRREGRGERWGNEGR